MRVFHKFVDLHLEDGHRGDLFLGRDGADAFLVKVISDHDIPVLETSYLRSRRR